MDEDREVFQDFSSDDSDFDDDVDWSFTDRESASVLQLMGGADSTKKPQRAGTAAISPSTVIKNTSATSSVPTGGDCITSGAVKGPSSDQKLLDELFPKTKTQLMSTAEIPIGEEQVRNKECEFEWALMALEEHESRSVSPVKGAADFASLFEEMYGGDTAIELSTPSKLEDDPLEKADSKQPVNDGIPSSPKAAESDEDTLPAEVFNMLQLVYTKATSEHLISQELVTSFASSREERLEFILSVLDNKIGSLPQTFKIKWVKTIEMLPLLIKMQEQRNCSEPASKRVVDLVNELQIDETAPKTKNKGSPLQGWATFHPDKMPARLHEPTKLSKATSLSKQTATTSSKKPRVHLRQYLPSKLRVRCKVYNPEDSELTFRPKINKKHRKKDQEQEEKFADRMERDISLRRSQKLQLEQKREQHEREEAGSVAPVNFIAKGSQRILLRNGMWTESLEERLHRLAKHRTNTEAHDPDQRSDVNAMINESEKHLRLLRGPVSRFISEDLSKGKESKTDCWKITLTSNFNGIAQR
ncbi:Lysophospholipid acyltransferase [Phytophthora nicotianae]|uniref:Lysophospholipid acyltransferase n=1 Tax=Phytophthora nicotianae TaxID=4792 RepID=A0A0W8DT87_PHYNI|nr:Lysophospholipid acyltransferase [Phytophthora nicotianae]